MNYYQKLNADAVRDVAELLALPMPMDSQSLGLEGEFFPWSLFPCLYGSYSSAFDDLAIDVLTEIRDQAFIRDDLAAEMFREMLCTRGLCDYGTSPRVCFADGAFRGQVAELVEKWTQYRSIAWPA